MYGDRKKNKKTSTVMNAGGISGAFFGTLSCSNICNSVQNFDKNEQIIAYIPLLILEPLLTPPFSKSLDLQQHLNVSFSIKIDNSKRMFIMVIYKENNFLV